MSRRSRNSRAWRYVWGGIRRDADARALVLASESEDWSYDLLEVSECLCPVDNDFVLVRCQSLKVLTSALLNSFSSSVILILRQTSHRWWSLLSPVPCLSLESLTVAAIPRQRQQAAATVACGDFTRSRTVTVERMTKVKDKCCVALVNICAMPIL